MAKTVVFVCEKDLSHLPRNKFFPLVKGLRSGEGDSENEKGLMPYFMTPAVLPVVGHIGNDFAHQFAFNLSTRLELPLLPVSLDEKSTSQKVELDIERIAQYRKSHSYLFVIAPAFDEHVREVKSKLELPEGVSEDCSHSVLLHEMDQFKKETK